MATISPKRVDSDNGLTIVTWTAVTTSDTGGPADVSDLYERTIHVVGSGTAQLAGSNDGSNYVSIGSALAGNSLTQMAVNPRFIDFTTIASATVTIILVGKRRVF